MEPLCYLKWKSVCWRFLFFPQLWGFGCRKLTERWVKIVNNLKKYHTLWNLLLLAEFVLAYRDTNAPVERMFSVMDDIWFEDKSGMSVDIVKGMTVVRANLAGNCSGVSEQLFWNMLSFHRKPCMYFWDICNLFIHGLLVWFVCCLFVCLLKKTKTTFLWGWSDLDFKKFKEQSCNSFSATVVCRATLHVFMQAKSCSYYFLFSKNKTKFV